MVRITATHTLAGYSPWKFPPEMVSPLSANTILNSDWEKKNVSQKAMWNFRFWWKDTGLSVALFISVLMMFWTNLMVSLAIPWTCAQKRGGSENNTRSKRSRKNPQRIHHEWDLGTPEDSIAWCRRPGPCHRSGGSLEKRIKQHVKTDRFNSRINV